MKNKWFKNRHFWGGFIACAILVVLLSLVSDGSIFAASRASRDVYPHDPNGADQTPPSVSMTAPIDGYTVDASTPRSPGGRYGNYFMVPVKGYASDNDKLQNVRLLTDGDPDGSVLDFGLGFNNYTVNWTARVPMQAGTHTVTLKAWDYNGNMSETSVSVIVPKGLK